MADDEQRQKVIASMPQWRCHKVVRAAQVYQITEGPGGGKYLILKDVFAPFWVSREWFERHWPKVGGFMVIYEDGYESYSPSIPFTQGYTRIDGPGSEGGD